MTITELRDLLARVSYKPGWSFHLIEGAAPLLVNLRVFFQSHDSTGEKSGTVKIQTNAVIPRMDLAFWREDDAIRAISGEIVQLEMYEFREWLKVDGKPVDDPHGHLKQSIPQLHKHTETR